MKNISREKLEAARELVDEYLYGDERLYEDEAACELEDEAARELEDESRPADGHWAEKSVVQSMERVQRLLSSVGLKLHGLTPGASVSAYDKRGNHMRFEHAGWLWLEEMMVEFVEMREFLRETREYLASDDLEKVQRVQDALLRAQEAEFETRKLRNLLASTLRVRGDKKDRGAGDLLRDVAQWHRASGDTAVCDHEADALDLLADQLEGMKQDAADGRQPEFGAL